MKAINIQNNEWVILDSDNNGVMTVFCNESNNTEQGALDTYNEVLNPSQEIIQEMEVKEALNSQLAEYQAYLDRTDHKDLPSYKPKPNEDIATIIATRDEYREFIRANKDN